MIILELFPATSEIPPMSNKRRRNEILSEVKEKFSACIGSGPGKTPVHIAARILNVSRQTVHRYINGEVIPRGDILLAAFREWGLVLRYRGVDIVATRIQSSESASLPPIQLKLFELVDDLRERDLDVKIGNKSVDGIELNVRLRFSA
jgi:hypothetical protein